MKKIEWELSIGLVGCKRSGVIEVDDDLSDEEIEDWISDEVNQLLEWHWKLVE